MFKLAGMGGNFDHLHDGHKLLLKTALEVSESIVIGLTTEEMHKKKQFKEKIEDYSTRKRNIEKFIQTFTDLERVQIIELNDSYGPPIEDENYEALIISQETIPNALKINEIRAQKSMKPLILVVIPILRDEKGNKISSTEIRKILK
jgi:pantetheine-phosphate adenylyltransferase